MHKAWLQHRGFPYCGRNIRHCRKPPGKIQAPQIEREYSEYKLEYTIGQIKYLIEALSNIKKIRFSLFHLEATE